MEKVKQTERAEKKPDKATQTNEKEPLVTKTVIEIRHNLVFPRNLDYIQSVHQMQPLSYFYTPRYWSTVPPNLPRYLRFREFKSNFDEFM